MAVFHKDPCGLICLFITYSAVFYADYCIVQHVVRPTLTESIWGSLHVCIFNIIVLLLTISHVRASFSDPGVVARPSSSLDFSEINKAKTKQTESENEWTVCAKCEAYRPPRAHHCRTCGRCIRKMDHHCPWINNCVGEANQKYFILFLFYTGLASLYSIILTAVSWTMECNGCTKDYEKRTRLIYTVILMIEGVLFGLFVLAMLCDQFSAITGDLTAVEHVQRQIRTNRKPRSALLAEVFGRGGFFIWFCPCSTPPSPQQSTASERYNV
ncbi:palmitoyltransferase ZDHHC3-like [Pocillopora damicornis]|uniref:palmitoyltransferase ZDHHC3-like n=1 Tax=Pocillopora damicornis TaxID=46731 RepID=UPI000F558464|nr:palmitoyltransferase ZDHHC3-like [Pocillopora damicornis]